MWVTFKVAEASRGLTSYTCGAEQPPQVLRIIAALMLVMKIPRRAGNNCLPLRFLSVRPTETEFWRFFTVIAGRRGFGPRT